MAEDTQELVSSNNGGRQSFHLWHKYGCDWCVAHEMNGVARVCGRLVRLLLFTIDCAENVQLCLTENDGFLLHLIPEKDYQTEFPLKFILNFFEFLEFQICNYIYCSLGLGAILLYTKLCSYCLEQLWCMWPQGSEARSEDNIKRCWWRGEHGYGYGCEWGGFRQGHKVHRETRLWLQSFKRIAAA